MRKGKGIVWDSVLYFPEIEIRNIGWLKSALLLWDHVYRIVPKGYSPHDSREMERAVDAGLVRSISLETADAEGIVGAFVDFVDHLEVTPAGLEALEDDEVERLHPDKVDAHLYPLLERYCATESSDGFIELPRELVRGYMFFLSTQVARRRQLARCTDRPDKFELASYFSENANFDDFVYDPEAVGYYSSLVLKDVLPRNVESVGMSEILSASSQSRDEKTAFRTALTEFADEVSACESTDHARQVVSDYANRLLEAKAHLRASQGLLGEAAVGSMLATGIPTALTTFSALATTAGSPFSWHTIAPSIVLGAVAAYSNFQQVRRVHHGQPGAAYLLSLDRRFSGWHNPPVLGRALEEFIND